MPSLGDRLTSPIASRRRRAPRDTTHPASGTGTSPGIDSEYVEKVRSERWLAGGRPSPPAYLLRRRPGQSLHAMARRVESRPARRAQLERALDVREPIGRPPDSVGHRPAQHQRGRAPAARASAAARASSRRPPRPPRTPICQPGARPPSQLGVLVPRELGLVRQHVDNRRIEASLEQRQQLGADAVARNRHIVVRLVVRRTDCLRLEIGTAAPRGGSRAVVARSRPRRGCIDARPRRARSPQRGAAGRFRPDRRACVRARRRRRQSWPRALEERVSRRARRVLERRSLAPRSAATSARSATNGRPRARGHARAEPLVRRRPRPAKLVVEMRDARASAVRPRVAASSRRCASATESEPPDSATSTRVSGRRGRAVGWCAGRGRAASACGTADRRSGAGRPAPTANVDGAGGQIRTVDPALMRRVLSPTELLRPESLIVLRPPVHGSIARTSFRGSASRRRSCRTDSARRRPRDTRPATRSRPANADTSISSDDCGR